MGRGEGIRLSLATTSHDTGLHIVLVLQRLFWMETIKTKKCRFRYFEIKHYFVIVIISAVKYLGHLSQGIDKCPKDRKNRFPAIFHVETDAQWKLAF